MRKTPFRKGSESISQSFSSGIVTIYEETNTAKPGYQPNVSLVEKGALRFEEQRLGLQRYYSGKQNQIKVERVIRVPKGFDISSQDVAITNNGKHYRIDLVQIVTDAYPACLDLTLVAYEQGRKQ